LVRFRLKFPLTEVGLATAVLTHSTRLVRFAHSLDGPLRFSPQLKTKEIIQLVFAIRVNILVLAQKRFVVVVGQIH
jgi:hypothetical protein